HFVEPPLPEDYWARDLVAVHGMPAVLKALARHAKGRGWREAFRELSPARGKPQGYASARPEWSRNARPRRTGNLERGHPRRREPPCMGEHAAAKGVYGGRLELLAFASAAHPPLLPASGRSPPSCSHRGRPA